ncbi:MAG: secondary thiamine-phosphate synthase enzyme YjbQ [Actinomycetota bacterium]|nr:secondary thiamine-phosphate synthase enzyme YjbQ [Actinomycetota bacterium]
MRSEVTIYDTETTKFLDITGDVERFVSSASSDGLVNVFVPHATAGVALIETGSGSEQDLAATLERLLPRDGDYAHRHGSPGHGRDHVLPAFVAPSLMIPVVDARLMLGTWQSVVLVDTNRDNPERTVRFSFISA